MLLCCIYKLPPRASGPVSHYKIDGRPGGTDFYRQIVGRGNFSGGQSYNKETFYGAGDILIRRRHIKSIRDYLSRADFSWGRHFNVTPAGGRRSVTVAAFPCFVRPTGARALALTSSIARLFAVRSSRLCLSVSR